MEQVCTIEHYFHKLANILTLSADIDSVPWCHVQGSDTLPESQLCTFERLGLYLVAANCRYLAAFFCDDCDTGSVAEQGRDCSTINQWRYCFLVKFPFCPSFHQVYVYIRVCLWRVFQLRHLKVLKGKGVVTFQLFFAAELLRKFHNSF